MSSEPVVQIIDDDEAMRDSVQFLLDTAGIKSVAHESAVAFLDTLSGEPACIVTDIRMPGLSGLDLIKELRARGIGTPVIVVTGHGDVPLAVEAMKLGAADFLEKPFPDEMLLGAVRAALNRREKEEQQASLRRVYAERLETLSERERQVLTGLVAGNANKAIAFDLGISVRTVEVYRANVMTKMQAASLSELVRMALIVGSSDGG